MAKYGFRYFTRRFLNIPRWMGSESLRSTAGYIRRLSRGLTESKQQSVKETFEEAVERLKLSEEDIQSRLKDYQRLAKIYFCLLVIAFVYFLYLVFHGYWVATIMMMTFMLLMFSFYFRESFWAVQIQQRRLGLTFKEWLFFVLGIKK